VLRQVTYGGGEFSLIVEAARPHLRLAIAILSKRSEFDDASIREE